MKAKNQTPWQLNILSLLALAGALVAGFQSKHYYGLRAGTEGFKSYCNLGQNMNCDAVALSSYADLFQGWPLSSFAAGWFLALLGVTLFARSANWRRDALRAVFGMSAFALLCSGFYFVVMATVIKSYCLLCMVVDGISILLFALALSLRGQIFGGEKADKGRFGTLTMVAAGALFISVIGLKGLEGRTLDSGTMRILVDQVITNPVLPVMAGPEFPSMGPANAPITIVEFADFQCPACRMGAMTMKALMNRYPDKVRVVFRNFPAHPACNSAVHSSGHPAACEAARVAVCAHREGKFAQVYEGLFENQLKLAPGKVAEVAQLADASLQLASCVDLPDTSNKVTADTEEGIRLNVRSTPTFFINGRRVEGAYPLTAWSLLVEHFLKNP